MGYMREPGLGRKEDEQRPSGEGSSRVLLAVLTACLTVLAVGVTSAFLLNNGKGQPGAAGGRPPAATARPVENVQSSAKPLPATAGISKKALRLPHGMKAAARSWEAHSGGVAAAAIATDLGAVTQSLGIQQYSDVRAACSALTHDVRIARGAPPIPDSAMQNMYVQALDVLTRGAGKCQSAITQRSAGDEYLKTHENQAQLRKSVATLGAGAKKLYRATAYIQSVARR